MYFSAVGRTLEEFKTSVTVAAHSKVTFELTYEELLKRRLGQYELLIKAKPTQAVKDFKVHRRNDDILPIPLWYSVIMNHLVCDTVTIVLTHIFCVAD